jgi:hypothetical protein
VAQSLWNGRGVKIKGVRSLDEERETVGVGSIKIEKAEEDKINYKKK